MATTNISSLEAPHVTNLDGKANAMVSIDHVSMIFNIASEQLNSLKEYAIALSKRELRFKEFYALDDISFEVQRGDVFGILGTNGSGKSTLLKIIAGVLEPSRGSAVVSGSIAPLIELGAGFDMELTARENIYLNGALLGYSKKFINQHFDEIVEFAEVRDFLDIPMKNYSSGMIARIAFAIATVIVPDLLIVDEVLSVGDFMFQQKCERRIQSLIKDHGVTVLIVSHNNDQIERLCNKAVWIEKGHMRAIGDAHEVCGIYRAIGGRSGGAEAEKRILDLLASAACVTTTSTPIYGEDRFGVASRINELGNASGDNIILVNNDFEKECRLSASLAGLLDAMVLTSRANHIPDSMLREIQFHNPNTIIVIGNEEQIEPQILQAIRPNAPHARIQRIEAKRASGKETFEHGAMLSEWGDTAIVADDESDLAILTLSPYAHLKKMPIFYLDRFANDREDLARILSGFSRTIVLFGEESRPGLTDLLPEDAEIIVFENCKDESTVNDRVNEWIGQQADSFPQSDSAIVVTPDNVVDNRLIGPFAGRKQAPVVFCTPQNLESTLHAARYLESRRQCVKHLYFLGTDARFSSVDRKILQIAASRTSAEIE